MGGRGSSSGTTSRLPKLEGSEKQIKWAEEIRNEAMKEIKEYIKLFNNKDFKEVYEEWSKSENKAKQMHKEDYDKFIKKIVNQTKASVWIENKTILTQKEYVTDSITDEQIQRGKRKIKEGKKALGYGVFINRIANRYGFDYLLY